jgi:hypothetical protein
VFSRLSLFCLCNGFAPGDIALDCLMSSNERIYSHGGLLQEAGEFRATFRARSDS